MKAIIYHGPTDVSCETIPDPELLEADDAIVRTTLCGICGSDLHPYHVHPGRSEFGIGHEAVGEVIDVGKAVTRFKAGDRVLVSASIGCGDCPPCQNGQVMFCHKYTDYTVFGQGLPHIGGCQAQAVRVPHAHANLWHLPDFISDEVGILLTDGLATAWLCARRARIRPGDVVSVIGLGPIGQQCVMAAFAMGASRVLAVDLLPARRADAARLGAEPVENSDAIEGILEMTSGRGADVVLDANGSAATIQLAIHVSARGGRVSIVGVSEVMDVQFPIVESMAKNIDLAVCLTSVQAELPALMKAVKDGSLSTKAMEGLISHRFDLDHGADAYALFDSRSNDVRKVLITPN